MFRKIFFYIVGFVLLELLISSFSLALEPPTKEQIELYKRDGTFERRLAAVKRLGNDKVSPYLVARAKYKLRKMQLKMQGLSDDKTSRVLPAPPPAWQGMPTKGTAKMFVLLIEFPDYPHKDSKESIQDKLFGDGSPEGYPYESLRNFYRRSSYNQLEITGEALGWYKTAYNRSTIVPDGSPDWSTDGTIEAIQRNLIKEAITYFHDQGHDFSQYDGNNDGLIDMFAVLWTGPDTGWGNFWWGYETSFIDKSFTVDGKKLNNFSWQWETNLEQDGTEHFTPITIIHETGHGLGLPDYYDYNGANGGDGGLDMMDGAWGDHNCFSKFLLDWITPEAVSGNGKTFSLNASGVSQDAVLVMPGIATGDAFNEFFMVQNRYRTGNDDVKNPIRQFVPKLPNDGLLIWHVDSTLDNTGQDFKYNNSDYPYHKLLRLMEADGLEEIEKGDRANAGDYFNKANKFTLNSIPNSSNYLNAKTGIAVKNISDSGPVMNCSISIGFCAPPSINTYESATALSSITLSGTMAASTTEIFINGSTNGVKLFASSWEAPVALSFGLNTIEVVAGTGTIESLLVTANITQKDFEIKNDALGVLLIIPQGSSSIVPVVSPEVYGNAAILGVHAPTSVLAGDIINFKSNVTSFSKLITITMKLNSLSKNPSVYFWDETTGAWNNSGISITSKTSSSITFTVNKLGIFGIFDSADNPQNILIYPNPAKISAGQNVIFNGLKGNEIIRIFTTAGEFVNYYDNNYLKAALWAWDLKNYSGNQVVQNIYAYVITNDTGQKKVGKIAVIK